MSEANKLLLFRKWDFEGIEVKDPGLQSVISLNPVIVPTSMGRHEHKKFGKSEVNIVERVANSLMHFGKKHAKNTGRMGGKKQRSINIVRSAFEIIALETGKNPIEVLVKALENSAPNEDTTRIAYGGVVYHVSVDISPQRRLDLALRFISEGVSQASFASRKSVEEVLADEIIAAANNDTNSYSIKKKNEQERIAMASR
ncbi:MAG: 30S ribosomal protein S7 [Thaumarchaeota archaeon]|nr:30S ribosomal protein S7 [Nitrososphaerota archaeon]